MDLRGFLETFVLCSEFRCSDARSYIALIARCLRRMRSYSITRAQTVDYPTYLRHVAARSEAYAFSCLNCYNCCIDSIATTTAVYRPSSCRTSDRDALLLFSTPPSEPPWRQTTNQAHSHYSYTHKPPFPQLIQGQVLGIQIIHTAPQISTKYTSSPCSNYTWTLPSLY